MRLTVWVRDDAHKLPPLPCDQAGVLWNGRAVSDGWVSLPQEFDARLEDIRAELLQFVYDFGRWKVDGEEVQAHLLAGDSLSQWWCSLLFEKHPKVTPHLYPALKLRALEMWMADKDITEITLFGGDSALQESLRQFCAATGRLFHQRVGGSDAPVKRGLRGWCKRLYYALPAPVKAMGRFIHWYFTIKRHLPLTRDTAAQGRYGTIATYFPNIDATAALEGRFRSRYWESLHDALAVTPQLGVHWLFIRFPSPQYSFAECLRLRHAFAGKDEVYTDKPRDTYHYLEEFIGAAGLWRAFRRYRALAHKAYALSDAVCPQCFLPHSRVNLWPYLGEYWYDSLAGWRSLERCIQREGTLAYTRWAGPQRWTIFPMENCPWERMLTEAVHTAGHGVVYGTQHSTVRPTDFRYFDDIRTFTTEDCRAFQPDQIFGNGTGACDAMLQAGTPPSMVGEVEALRYMYLARTVNAAALQKIMAEHPPVPEFAKSGSGAAGQSPDAAGVTVTAPEVANAAPAPEMAAPDKIAPQISSVEAPASSPVTADAAAAPATGGTAAAGQGAAPRRSLLVVTSFFADEVDAHMRVLAQWMARPEAAAWEVRIKPHPYLAVPEFWKKWCAPGQALPPVVEGAIEKFLLPGTVVWASNSTTVALEAALTGLPTLVQLPEDDVDLCPLQGVEGVARVGSVEDACAALAEPRQAQVPDGYLALNPALPRWRRLLGLALLGGNVPQ